MGLLDSVIGALGQAQGQGGAAGGDAGGALGGLLGSLMGGGAGGAGGGQAEVLGTVLGMLANDAQGGGLGGLIAKFQQAGMGDVVGSWISSGQNLPISPEQLGGVLGEDTLAGLARQLGLGSGSEVAGPLSQLLPQVVDRLTPGGQLPEGGLGNLSDLLGGSLMGR